MGAYLHCRPWDEIWKFSLGWKWQQHQLSTANHSRGLVTIDVCLGGWSVEQRTMWISNNYAQLKTRSHNYTNPLRPTPLEGSKYQNRKHIPQAMISIPETIDAPSLGTLDPYGDSKPQAHSTEGKYLPRSAYSCYIPTISLRFSVQGLICVPVKTPLIPSAPNLVALTGACTTQRAEAGREKSGKSNAQISPEAQKPKVCTRTIM